MVRLSHSHIRIGTFQRIAAEGDAEMMQRLVEYCLTILYNEALSDNPAAQLLDLAVERIAELAASYMVAGFVHGVLNTDNINITGESFDYGPWRGTEFWDPRFTAAYFDESGLYAFGRQAEAAHWNLGQLAVSLRLICDAPPLVEALERFPVLFQNAIIRRFLWRLGIKSQGEEKDRQLGRGRRTSDGTRNRFQSTCFSKHIAVGACLICRNMDRPRVLCEILGDYQTPILWDMIMGPTRAPVQC